jgi:hypothetical protein
VPPIHAALLFLPLLAACGVVPPRAAAGLPDPEVVAFVGANVISMAPAAGISPDQTVIVRDGRIAALGPATAVRIPRGALRIDATGQYLLPGLADMHVHLEHSDDPRFLTLFLANGVTTVRNIDGRSYILRWKEMVARGELPAIYTAGPILDGDPPVLRAACRPPRARPQAACAPPCDRRAPSRPRRAPAAPAPA